MNYINYDKVLYIGDSIQSLRLSFGIELYNIPFVFNQNYSLFYDESQAYLYVLKTISGVSITELFNTPEKVYEYDNGLDRLKENYINWQIFINEQPVNEQNPIFKRIVNRFNDRNFKGLIIFGLDVKIKNKEAIGNNVLIKDISFYSPYIEILDIDFRERWADTTKAYPQGILSIRKPRRFEEKGQKHSLTIERIDVSVTKNKIDYSGTVLRMSFGTLFSSVTGSNGYLDIYGTYTQKQQGTGFYCYNFCILNKFRLNLFYSMIEALTVDTAEINIDSSLDSVSINMCCYGKLFFRALSETFDPFSYGSQPEQHNQSKIRALPDGLPYSLLDVNIKLESQSIKCFNISSKRLVLHSNFLSPRKNSFADGFSSKPVEFISYENAVSPAEKGYGQIIVPVKQNNLGKHWYGLVFPIELVKGVTIRMLFAWSTEENEVSFYAGAMIDAFGTPKQFNVTVASLFRVGFQSIALQTAQNGDIVTYTIVLNGLSLGLLSLSFPQDGCNLALISSKDEFGNKCNAWYGVYDKIAKQEG